MPSSRCQHSGVPSPRPIHRDAYHHGDLRRALVAAGVGLAREGGPAAIVLRETARRVGVSPNAAYRHFADLPDLIAAVAEEALGALAASMQAELAAGTPSGDPQPDALNRLMAVGRGYVLFALAEPGLFATAFTHPRTRTGHLGPDGAGPYDLLEQSLDAMLAAGVLATADRAAAATTAWAAVHGLAGLLLGPLAGLPADGRGPLIEATLELVARGLIIPGWAPR